MDAEELKGILWMIRDLGIPNRLMPGEMDAAQAMLPTEELIQNMNGVLMQYANNCISDGSSGVVPVLLYAYRGSVSGMEAGFRVVAGAMCGSMRTPEERERTIEAVASAAFKAGHFTSIAALVSEAWKYERGDDGEPDRSKKQECVIVATLGMNGDATIRFLPVTRGGDGALKATGEWSDPENAIKQELAMFFVKLIKLYAGQQFDIAQDGTRKPPEMN
jgi:hypothetical protein